MSLASIPCEVWALFVLAVFTVLVREYQLSYTIEQQETWMSASSVWAKTQKKGQNQAITNDANMYGQKFGNTFFSISEESNWRTQKAEINLKKSAEYIL